MAPPMTITAIKSGRVVDLQNPGVVTLMLCMAQETQDDADEVEMAVRQLWPHASDVSVINVIDLRKVPGIFHKIAEGIMGSEYDKAAKLLEPEQDAPDYVVILPDWHGDVAKTLDLDDVSKVLASVILRPDGRIVGIVRGVDCEGAVRLVREGIAKA